MRLDATIAEWSRTYLGEDKRTELIETLFQAIQEKRLVVFSHPISIESNTGNDPEFPVLVSTTE